jgi:outer membrane protein assembly factor BamB
MVSIAVDADATKTLLTIEDRWAADDIAAPLDDLITLAETRGDSIVQTARGAAGQLTRYQAVSSVVETWLGRLTPTQLAIYRRRVDPIAERLWDSWAATGEPADLEQLAERYFFSSRGADAVWTLGQLAWSAGDWESAEGWWRQLLTEPLDPSDDLGRRYPDPPQSSVDVLARCLLCRVWSGRLSPEAALARYGDRLGDAAGRLAGRDGLWRELLVEAWREPSQPPWSLGGAVTSYAGTAKRDGRALRDVDLGGELWSVKLEFPLIPRAAGAALFAPQQPLACYPAVVEDVVYLNDGGRIWAWNLLTGTPAWDVGLTNRAVLYPPVPPETIRGPARPVRGEPLWTVTLGGGRLYAVMGSPVTTPTPLEMRDVDSELIALDVSTGEGKLAWSLTADDISRQLRTTEDAAPTWMWEGTPVLLGTRLYGVLARRRPQLEWSVVCLDAASGRLLWHRSVGMSRPAPPEPFNLASHLLLTADRAGLYLATQWGAIAALDPATGALRWVVTYESDPLADRRRRPGATAAPPALLVGDRLYVAPTDSRELFCLEARGGAVVWQQTLGERIEHLLGVEQGTLVVAGRSLFGLAADTGTRRWSLESAEPEAQGYGRGWMTATSVYWPTRESLLQVEVARGRILREQPLATADSGRQGGHVVIAGGVVLVTGADRITAYGETATLRQESEGWLSRTDADDQSAARFRLAELAMATGDHAAADQMYAEVVARAGAPDDRWSVRAEGRRLHAALRLGEQRPDGPNIATQRDFARAWSRVTQPVWRQRLSARELEVARDPAWMHEAAQRYLAWLARSPPAEVSLPTWSIVTDQLLTLRRTHGAALFARSDAEAAARLAEPHAVPELLLREYPTAPALTAALSAVTSTAQQTADSRTPRGPILQPRWRHALDLTTRVIVPRTQAGLPRSYLLVAARCDWRNTADDALLGEPRLSAPPWQAWETADGLILVSPREVVAVDRASQAVRWRIGREEPQQTAAARPSPTTPPVMHETSNGLIVIHQPQVELAAYRIATGELAWRIAADADPWGPRVAVQNDLLLGQSTANGKPWRLDLRTGALTRLGTSQRPWLRSPAVAADTGDFVTVDDQRRIQSWSPTGELRWDYVGVVSAQHVDPWVGTSAGRFWVVLDGQRFTPILSTGWPAQPIPVSLMPIRDPATSLVTVDGRLLVARVGGLMAIDLDTGRVLWSTPRPGLSAPQWIAGPGLRDLWLLDHGDPNRPPILERWDPDHGRPRQSLPVPVTEALTVHPVHDGLLVQTTETLSHWSAE